MQERGKFSNKIGFIAAAAGSAVGLGNIWKFPYETGANGGAAFLLIYLLCAFVICMPIMVAEIAMGRHARLNPYGTFKKLGSRGWGIVGLLGIISGAVILSFYNVVSGWAFGYFLQISFGKLLQEPDFASFFTRYIADVGDNLLYSLAFMVLTAAIVLGGVQKGIERWTKILMPLLIVIMLVLIVYGLTLPHAGQGIEFYLVPDMGEVTANTFYMALSQAFFSLSLGMGALITYGSYISDDDHIVNSAALVTITDTLIAFMAGLMIFPLVFSQGIEPGSGPGLVFVSLPGIFEAMGPGIGNVIGGAFFLLLCFAALTSTVSLLEIPVSFITDQYKISRKKAVIGLATLIFLLGLPSMFSQGAVGWLTEFVSYGGKSHDFMTVIIDIFSDIGLPLGGLLISIFVAYRWRMQNFSAEVSKGNPGFPGSRQEQFVSIMLSYVSPLVILFMLMVIVMEKFFEVDVLSYLF